jgi:hypothetical protein
MEKSAKQSASPSIGVGEIKLLSNKVIRERAIEAEKFANGKTHEIQAQIGPTKQRSKPEE